ncbi:SRPBCC family protein [Belnapia sp. T6]|uniref:SRPBCC family protein n=1 Tax=Belnapia mucosa TaxID=2804532 RepID=A0ABS1VA21_9PROT|nr:SRPBCC family protein [Belnapia mucosa]MBL6458529.1 SRPBCC family protein [Belnapia mucosa]
MGEFTGRIRIDRPAAEVFAFLSDPTAMPRYLQTVNRVEQRGPGRIAMEGEAHGHAYHDEGWIKLEPEARRMRWGSDRMKDYGGEMEVQEADGGAEVSIRLSITPDPAVAKQMEQESGAVDHAMRLAMERTLGAIKAACEGVDAAPDAPRSADDLPDSRPFGSSATLNPDI